MFALLLMVLLFPVHFATSTAAGTGSPLTTDAPPQPVSVRQREPHSWELPWNLPFGR